jgi:hypothetical protein
MFFEEQLGNSRQENERNSQDNRQLGSQGARRGGANLRTINQGRQDRPAGPEKPGTRRLF